VLKPLYLIGASQVGKTTAAQILASSGTIRHVDLDAVVKKRHPHRSRIESAQDGDIVEPILGELDAQRTNLPMLVTVGAGTQDRDRHHCDRKLEGWLAERSDRVILIEGDPDVLYSRNDAHQGNRAQFDTLEFGPKRCQIYATAGTVISFRDADQDEAASRLARAISDLPEAAG